MPIIYTIIATLLLSSFINAEPISEYENKVVIGNRVIHEIYLHKVNYRDGDSLREINPTLIGDSGDFAEQAANQEFKVRFDNTGKRRIYLSENSYFEIGRLQYKQDNNVWANLPITSVTISANRFRVNHSLYSIDFINTPDVLKMDITITSTTALRPIRFGYVANNVTLTGSSNTATWTITGDNGKQIMIGRPFIDRDGNGDVKPPRPCEFYRTASYIYATADVSGLALPIHIDPSVYYSTQPYSNADTFIEDDYPTSSDGTGQTILTGVANNGGSLNIQRVLMKFNVSSIPAGATCLGATMYMTLTYADNPTSDRATSVYSIRSGRSDWNYLQATWNEYKSGASWGTAGCSDTTTDYNPTAIGTFDSPTSYPSEILIPLSNTTVSTWFGESNSNYGIVIKQDVETNNYRKKEWASSRHTTATYRPRLLIEYSEALPVDYPYRRIIRIGGN